MQHQITINYCQTTNSPLEKNLGEFFPYEKFFGETNCETIRFLWVRFSTYLITVIDQGKYRLDSISVRNPARPSERAYCATSQSRKLRWILFFSKFFNTLFTTGIESQLRRRCKIYFRSIECQQKLEKFAFGGRFYPLSTRMRLNMQQAGPTVSRKVQQALEKNKTLQHLHLTVRCQFNLKASWTIPTRHQAHSKAQTFPALSVLAALPNSALESLTLEVSFSSHCKKEWLAHT